MSTHLESPPKTAFPGVFWSANTTELFERAAYYSMASFVVIYLGRLGLGEYWPSTLNSWLWTLVYFLPILSGTIADIVGFRKALLAAFVLLVGGYFMMGWPVWFGGAVLQENITKEVTAGANIFVPVLLGIVLIGLGGSVVKPCISGTVQKSHMGRATLAFAIFYMVINIGSIFGRVVAYGVRNYWKDLSLIFIVANVAAVGAFFVVLASYHDPDRGPSAAPQKSPKDKLLDMVRVLGNKRFLLFLLASSGFWFLYNQVYNVLPLYTKRVIETNPAMDLYTAANPITIVCFQLLITKLFGKVRPIRSIVVGTIIIGLAMVINLVPLFVDGGVRGPLANWLPIGSVFIIFTVALIAFGELFTSARTFEWIGAMAPKGQEGLFLGYANLPMAIGSLLGGPVGAWIFNAIMAKGATERPDGLLDLVPTQATLGWVLLMAIGFASALGMWSYNLWLEKQKA